MIISVFDRVENIVRKGEIACTKASFPYPSKGVIVWKWVNTMTFASVLTETFNFTKKKNCSRGDNS